MAQALLVSFVLAIFSLKASAHPAYPLLASYDEPSRQDLEYVRGRLLELTESGATPKKYAEPRKDTKQAKTIPEINQPFYDYLYQGDITLTPAQVDHVVASRSKRQAINTKTGMFKRFPNDRESVIGYYMTGFYYYDQDLIRKAIHFWEDHACIKFEENSNSKSKLKIFNAGANGPCNSYIGKIYDDREQLVNLGHTCMHFGIIVHEIGHALGLFHEHTRADRDKHVIIRKDNLFAGMKHNFDIHPVAENDNQGVEYDYGSIMHYGQMISSFANNEKLSVMDPTPGNEFHNNTMGQTIKPSFLDLKMVNKLYECDYKCSEVENTCKNSGFLNPQNCGKCICPWGFGGDACELRDTGKNGTSSCGGDLTASRRADILNAWVGTPNRVKEIHESCHWHIRAEKGQKIKITIQGLRSFVKSKHSWFTSDVGCGNNNVEFKMKEDKTLTGYRFCIHGIGESFVSEDNFVIVSAYATGMQFFKIQYSIV
ncbi:hypothetical protein L596_026921 [Steinernema carpocapsae]|uniref:Zinc metalloproteinase n=1 Tax=Steinernema carpocapsae TaxID=34508 RepID=A0A4U5M2S0_STECR|nr:hypothetical protein L596_026921 [Steinernema carpocapsae]